MTDFSSGLSQAVQDADAKKVVQLVKEALAEGLPAMDILEKGLVPGVQALGQLFKDGQDTYLTTFSPDMFAEFFFPYQLPILERFGLSCYGCCEPLDKRWDVIRNTPRLRRVSVSPWADRADMADKLDDQYIYSMKPNPVDLAVPSLNEERIRTGLRRDLQITRNCHVEIIMKDNHTIGNNPQNVIRWCQIAREEAEAI